MGKNWWANCSSANRFKLYSFARDGEEGTGWSRGGAGAGKVPGEVRDVVAAGLARAQDLPEDTVSLALGIVADNVNTRGVADLDLALGRDVFAFASGELAVNGDWAAAAGLKVKW